MSSDKNKIYDIEVILLYRTNEIIRDYTLCSPESKTKTDKLYDLERILNKNIYDYVNNTNSITESVNYDKSDDINSNFKRYFKKLKGSLTIPFETNYLDVKIIEQIFNSTNSENTFKLDELLIEKINDNINIITEKINENINPNIKDLKKYYFNNNENSSQNEFLKNILTKIIQNINDEESLKEIFTKQPEQIDEEKQYILGLKEIIDIQTPSGNEIIEQIINFLTNDTNKKENILYKELNYPYAFIFLPDNLSEIIKINKEKIKTDNKNIEINEHSFNETSKFNYLTIKTKILYKETGRQNSLAYIKLLSKVIANTKDIFNFNINTEIDKCRNLILFYFFYKTVFVSRTPSSFLDFITTKITLASESLPNIIKKASTNSDTNSSEHIITQKLDEVLSFIYDYIQSYKSNNNLIDLNIYADFLDEYIKLCEKILLQVIDDISNKITKLNEKIQKIISNDELNYYEYTLLIKFVTKYLNMQNMKLDNSDVNENENENEVEKIIENLDTIHYKKIFELKEFITENEYSKYFENMHKSENKNEIQILNFIQIKNIIKNTLDYYKDNNSKEGSPLYYLKKRSNSREDYDLFKHYIDRLLSTVLNFIYKLNIDIYNGELRHYLEKDQDNYDEDSLIEKFGDNDLSIYDLFLKKQESTGEKSDKYINALFNILNKDSIKYEKYQSSKEFRSEIIKDNENVEILPKGYITSEKKKNILKEYGKYFNYFTSDTDKEEEYLTLERNKDDVKKIITYYNIYHILKYLYVPKGTIINDFIYDINENKELHQFFTINDIKPISQKKEVQFIKDNKIRVFYEIDYTINKLNSYIELNINFYNGCEQLNIIEKDNDFNDEADYNTIIFTKDNDINKYSFKGSFIDSQEDDTETNSDSENNYVNKIILEYIKKCILKHLESKVNKFDDIIKDLPRNLNNNIEIDSDIDIIDISPELFEKLNIDNILNFKHEINYVEPDEELLEYLKNDKKYNSEELIDIIFNDNLKKLVKENNSKPDKSKELNYPIDKKITYKLESKDKRITKINNEDDIKNYIIGDENEIEEIVTNFSNKFDDSKEIKLNKGELAYLSIDYNKFKEIIDDITIENIIKINNNIYSFNYDIETIMIEDKYSKQLYELYDASIFDKKFKPTKIYFDDNINYEKIRSDYEKLILTKDIFIKNNDKIKSIEDTFLIEETSNYYKINYIDSDVDPNDVLRNLFIDYFYFKTDNDLLVNGNYYNIRDVEIILPKKLNIDSSNIYVKKQSNDIRLKYKGVDNIYQIYLYINYYKKKNKTDKVPLGAIISSGSNCIAKANIIDKKLHNALGNQYEQKFFTKKLLHLLNDSDNKDDETGDKNDDEINKLKSMGKDSDSEEMEELKQMDEAEEKEKDKNDKDLMKLKKLGNDSSIEGGNKKTAVKRKYYKSKKNKQLKTRASTFKLIKDYLNNNYLFII